MTPPWLKTGFVVEKRGQTPPWFKQVHGATVLALDGRSPTSPAPEADAGFTRRRGQEVYVFTADCLPVLLHGDSPTDPIAAIHAGWRGALHGVVAHTLRALEVAPARVHAVIGPSIGVCCFEVKQDFVDAFAAAGRDVTPYLKRTGDTLHCDLLSFVLKQELKGVASVNISAHRCTVCSLPLLPSYRRSGKADPMIRSFIAATNA